MHQMNMPRFVFLYSHTHLPSDFHMPLSKYQHIHHQVRLKILIKGLALLRISHSFSLLVQVVYINHTYEAHQVLVHAYEYRCNGVINVSCHLLFQRVDRILLPEYYYCSVQLGEQNHIYEHAH
ncbi:Uncharacterised protein [Streptococcus pneumoniae]|nr:Uncharacterised protein [Streptococcus pneumoniae]